MFNERGENFWRSITSCGILIFALLILFAAPARADCVNPAGAESKIIYNSDFRVLQYCDGTKWTAMHGPGPGTGGCIDPARNESAIIYNADHRVMQGCAGGDWQAMGPLGGKGRWLHVSAGSLHACAIRTDGTLWCWGNDVSGELGNGAVTGNQLSPVQESTLATDWASVVAGGSSHTCAVKTNGTLWCWGSDSNGQLGNGVITGNQVSPVQESTSATDWASVSVSASHTCAVKTNGTLWCWGSDSNGQLGNGAVTGNQVSPVQESTSATDWASVSVSAFHTCAVKSNGTLWCWGSDGSGELGNGADGAQISPDQESTLATDWSSVSASKSSGHTCAVKTNGTLWCWGNDGNGQLGNGAVTGNQVSPVQESTAATNWAMVSAGGHTCAIKTNGTLWCWGWDGNGQLGNGSVTGNQTSPMLEATSATDWSTVSAGINLTCAIKADGMLWCWGLNSNGQLGNDGYTGDQVTPRRELSASANWTTVSAGSAHTCAAKANGTLWCWGDDVNGQLGNGAIAGDQISPIEESTSATDWSSLSAGSFHTCAIKTNGTLWCWGSDSSGQLGNGAVTGNQASPVQESTSATDWALLSAGTSFTCAIKTNGTLWCWGSDSFGQLGNGAVTGNQISPVQEESMATDWASVSASSLSGAHTCAIKTNGTLWCWGADFSGQLGNGAGGSATGPVQESTSATDWSSVWAGSGHTCAVKSDGTLWCWGGDTNGQLGNGAVTGNQISPVQESTAATNWSDVSAGNSHTCAIKTTGTLWCWGNDASGQIGNGAVTGNQISPVQETSNSIEWSAVATGQDHTCGVKSSGTLWCWGDDANGRLGAVPLGDSPIENSGCFDPVRSEGALLYNSSANAMQYCDGVSWVPIGKRI